MFVCEGELETEQNCNILTRTLMAVNVVSFLFSRTTQPEAQGLTLLVDGFLYCIFSGPQHVVYVVSYVFVKQCEMPLDGDERNHKTIRWPLQHYQKKKKFSEVDKSIVLVVFFIFIFRLNLVNHYY